MKALLDRLESYPDCFFKYLEAGMSGCRHCPIFFFHTQAKKKEGGAKKPLFLFPNKSKQYPSFFVLKSLSI